MAKFSVGDWALFEHNIVQIKKTKDNRVTSVSDGSIETGGWDLSDCLFPLTIEGKSCADWFHYHYIELHREEGSNKLNWPDLSRKIVDLWADTMLVLGDEEKTRASYDKASEFFREVKTKLADVRRLTTTDGLKLFR